jgi:serine/threonine protein kinase
MSSLSREDWRDIMALLDTALEIEEAARPAWFAALGPQHERLKPMLDELLRDHSLAEPDATLGGATRNGANARSMPASGSLIGPYRVLREIGQGGMASVWLAERADGLLARRVALKLPHIMWGNSSLAERMARERNILGSLSHPHIARLYDVGTADDGRPFLALEYVDGQPIDRYAGAKAHASSSSCRWRARWPTPTRNSSCTAT